MAETTEITNKLIDKLVSQIRYCAENKILSIGRYGFGGNGASARLMEARSNR